jgi:hypothetical protein
LAEFAQKTVDASLADGASNVESPPMREASLAFSFSPDGTCRGDFEKTGTVAIVKEWPGSEAEGVVDLRKASSYCWKATYKPVFELQFAAATRGECSSVTSGYRSVANPYSILVINAVSVASSSGPPKVTEIDLPTGASGLAASGGGAASAVGTMTVKDIRALLDAARFEPTGGRLSALVRDIVASKGFAEGKATAGSKEFEVRGDEVFVPTSLCVQGTNCSGAGGITWRPEVQEGVRVTPLQATALGVSESLRRCAVHGISSELCFGVGSN